MIRKSIYTTITSAFICGMFSTAFAAAGGDVITSDPSKHFDEKGKMPSKFGILHYPQKVVYTFDVKRKWQ